MLPESNLRPDFALTEGQRRVRHSLPLPCAALDLSLLLKTLVTWYVPACAPDAKGRL